MSNETEYEKTLVLEGYKILLQHIQYEGNLIWARTTSYLTINAVWFGFLSATNTPIGAPDKPFAIVGSVIGAIFAITWLGGLLGARAYYRYWWAKLDELEHKLAPLDIFQTGARLFTGKVVVNGVPITPPRLARYLRVTDIHTVLAFSSFIGWLVFFVIKVYNP